MGSPYTFTTIKKLYGIFNSKQKKSFGWLAGITFLSSLTDLLGLTSVIPVVGLVLSPTYYNKLVHSYPILGNISKDSFFLYTVALFLLLIILKNVFGLYVNRLQVRFVQNFFVYSTMNVLNKVYSRSLPELQKETSIELASKLTTLQITLSSNAVISLMIIINEMMIFGLTAIIACIWNWALFLLLIGVTVSTVGLFYTRVKNMIRDAGTEKTARIVELYSSAQEMVYGYTDIKIAGTENSFKKKLKEIARKYSQYQGKIDFMMFIPTRIIEIAIFLCVIIILIYGVYVLKDNNQIITTITVFSMIAYRSIPSINRFVMAMNNFNATEFIFDDPEFSPTDESLDIPEEEEKVPLRELYFKDRILFDDVSYKYDGGTKMIIKNCNLVINKGEKIGIVGKSGAGKSTLISNILGFLPPTSGVIYIDDKPLNSDNIKDWWKILGYVRQDVFIMNTTFLENIAIGEPLDKIDMARMRHAIKLASLDDLVSEMPNGMNEIIKERGNNLSGGQKQRISIARAIYKGAEILIFDEATSALDSKTEEDITNSIRELGKENLTIIIIAHRYTSLRYCDKIYALEDGQIAGMFSYNDLINTTKA